VLVASGVVARLKLINWPGIVGEVFPAELMTVLMVVRRTVIVGRDGGHLT